MNLKTLKKSKTAICAIIKNEHRYIKEWIDYHLNLGIDEIYLYEDYGSDSHKELLKDYKNVFVYSLKDCIPYDFGIQGMILQILLYRSFLKRCKEHNLFDWVLFIDIDEYLTFEEGYDLERLESEYKDYPGILLSWKMFNANGHIKRPEGKLIDNYKEVSNFLKAAEIKYQFKSLVNVKNCVGMHNHHQAVGAVHTNGRPSRYELPVYEKAWINHYYTKSWEDFKEKLSKGNLGNNLVDYDNFFNYNPELYKYVFEKDNLIHKSFKDL